MINKLYKIFKKYGTITIDSRNVPKNSIFWALKGENFDGNKFIEDALKKGASFAVTDNQDYYIKGKTFLTENSLKALQELAHLHRTKLNLPIIALTGTNGKTTTKELINAVLSTEMNVKATKGNFNNHIGVPLTLLSFDEKTETGIVETGANHPGEIKELCETAEPNFGLITNIGKAHLEGFGSFENVIKTKYELYQSIIKNKGVIFYNSDNEILKKLKKGNKTISYGTGKDNFLSGKLVSAFPFLKLQIKTNKNEKVIIETNLTGKYNFENILAAACIGSYFDININNIKKGIESYIPTNNRSQIVKTGKNTILLDAYNANPSSMRTALENFTEYPDKNKMIILGDMFELGKYSKPEHTEILKTLTKILKENKTVKKVIVCGNYFKEAYNPTFSDSGILHFDNTEKLKNYLSEISLNNFMILIKGSRSMQMENTLSYL